jgi:hypothetical protein
MKLIIIAVSFFISTISFAQNSSTKTIDPNKKILVVEASCGQCQFKMAGKGCTLAVRIEGKSYFVDKAKIDDYGDAHSKMGFCNAIRKAKVQGDIVDGKFVATYFELIEK